MRNVVCSTISAPPGVRNVFFLEHLELHLSFSLLLAAYMLDVLVYIHLKVSVGNDASSAKSILQTSKIVRVHNLACIVFAKGHGHDFVLQGLHPH